MFLFLLMFAFYCKAEPDVASGSPSYGEWAPEMRELHIRIPLIANPDNGDDTFAPQEVLVDSIRPLYSLWYFDGTTYDYEVMRDVSKKKIEVFIPVFWKPGEEHIFNLSFIYCGRKKMLQVKAQTPSEGGAWTNAQKTANIGFCVKEECGIARTNEIVDFDVVAEKQLFPVPAKCVRATIFNSRKHTPVACQVYEVEEIDNAFVRFRTAVPITLPAYSSTIVFLWNCKDNENMPPTGSLRMWNATDAAMVSNEFYLIRLSPLSGQLMTWQDLKRGILFDYQDPRKLKESERVINRTPDVYRVGKPWSHALDWQPGQYQQKNIEGPLFIETIRWGKMPFVDEFSCNVRYRFIAGRQEVFITSVISADKDAKILALRNGGISLTPSLFTHAAWQTQDGGVKIISVESALGNDTGSPPAARMPTDTPWIALYHADKKYGFSVHTLRQAYFNKEQYHSVTARRQSYVSVYRHYTLYTIRSMTQTYFANIHSLPVIVHAGTEFYEEMAFVPFEVLTGNNNEIFKQVQNIHKRLTNPLVIIP